MTKETDEDEPLGNGESRWHVSRNIPVAFIVSMLVYAIAQTATAAWFASSMAYRVEAIERIQVQTSPQGERLTRVEEKLVAVQTGITDIKALLQSPNTKPR